MTALRTKMPLTRPYHLSLVTLDNFDSVLVRIQVNGKEGFGETTDVPGYFHETPEDAWNFIERWAPAIVGRQAKDALQEISEKEGALSFAATPLLTALEELIHTLNQRDPIKIRLPLLGVVQGESIDDLVSDTVRLQDLGFNTLKFKVGFDVEEDLRRLQAVQRALKAGVQVRIDANQGYSFEQAKRFLKNLDPEGIELLEQPLAIDAWDEMSRLAAHRTVPLMLDEAISSEADLDRTVKTGCAQAVKFKLMKCGSMGELARLINKAHAEGLKVIVGNGVALDIGCRHEALVLHQTGLIEDAGEMNGFLKCKEQSFDPSLEVEDGYLCISEGQLRVRWDILERFAVQEKVWGHIEG
jgi:o-succinylbenzoate synthase